jgi:RNA polymerase sigma factor (sigma-70 family)
MTVADPARNHLVAELERVALGDQGALHNVYQLTSAKLFGVCLHIVGERTLAEDVLQEVYLKVWQGAAAFDPARASPITWLCMIARNRAIDWRRAAGRYEAAVAGAGDMADTQPPETSGEDSADARGLLHQCLDALEESPRSSIRAAFLEGFTYSELAERARVPLGTMKSWIRRGLAQVRKCIEDA